MSAEQLEPARVTDLTKKRGRMEITRHETQIMLKLQIGYLELLVYHSISS